MTDPKPCLPTCHPIGHTVLGELWTGDRHDPACTKYHAPAPESKQGSEVDFDGAEEWLRMICAEMNLGSDEDQNALDAYRALRARLAEIEAERDSESITVTALRAELSTAKEESAKSEAALTAALIDQVRANTRAEKAEARVREDETFIAVLIRGCQANGRCTLCNHRGTVAIGHYAGCAVLLATAILAARKEGSK